MSKALKITEVQKLHRERFGRLKRVTLHDGSYVDVHMAFKATDMQRFVLDYAGMIAQLKEKGLGLEIVKDVTFLYYMLLIKHFSSLTNLPKDVEKLIVLCEKLVDLGLLEEIVRAFPKEELDKLTEAVMRMEQSGEAGAMAPPLEEMMTRMEQGGEEIHKPAGD